jgi:hypothetical protein
MCLNSESPRLPAELEGSSSVNGTENNKEVLLHMNHLEIIFFDELGFGWVVDKAIIKMIHATSSYEEIIVERTLADLLRRA